MSHSPIVLNISVIRIMLYSSVLLSFCRTTGVSRTLSHLDGITSVVVSLPTSTCRVCLTHAHLHRLTADKQKVVSDQNVLNCANSLICDITGSVTLLLFTRYVSGVCLTHTHLHRNTERGAVHTTYYCNTIIQYTHSYVTSAAFLLMSNDPLLLLKIKL